MNGTACGEPYLNAGTGMAQALYRLRVPVCFLMFSSIAAQAQWIPQPVPPDVSVLLSVDVSSVESGVACGYDGSFTGGAIYTSNGGTTWHVAQVPDSSRSLVSVQLFESGVGYIAGAYNSSLPGGKSQLPHGPIISGDRAQSACVDFMLRIGMNGGDNYRGLFLRSTNHGESWSTWGVLPDSTEYLIGISFANPDTGWVTTSTNNGSQAGILKTTDGGLTWTAVGISDSIVSLPSIRHFNSNSGVAVGRRINSGIFSGVILRTTDGGSMWEERPFPQVSSFTGVSVSDSVTAYASGRGSEVPLVYKTTNMGEDWAPLVFPPSDCYLQGVSAANETAAGVVYGTTSSYSPCVARTTDGGSQWGQATLPPIVPKSAILTGGVLLDENNGYLVGSSDDGPVVLHTTNGGLAGHFPLEAGNLWQLWDGYFNYVLEVEATGDTTFPNGETYTIVDGHGIGFGGRYVRQEEARVMSYDTYSGTERVIYDFEAEVGDTIGDGGDLVIILEEKLIVEFFGRQLLAWTFGARFFESVMVLDSIGLYTVWTEAGHTTYDFQGAIINGAQYGTITDLVEDSEWPLTVQLHQNYPNPFNPSTTIMFSIPKSGEVSLRIFNLLGEEVATLVSGLNDAGTHTVQWDATGQPSGVYFYRLQAGEFVETRKLVLLR